MPQEEETDFKDERTSVLWNILGEMKRLNKEKQDPSEKNSRRVSG
jgi:hypothetical protein